MKLNTKREFVSVGECTEHFELMRQRNGYSYSYGLYYVCEKEKPWLLVRVSSLITEAEKTMMKFERLYPCHFLAKEWQARERVILGKPRK